MQLTKGTVPCKLSELKVRLCYDPLEINLNEAMNGSGLILHHSMPSLDSIIMHYGAVVTATKVVANNGDFVLVEHEEVCSNLLYSIYYVYTPTD